MMMKRRRQEECHCTNDQVECMILTHLCILQQWLLDLQAQQIGRSTSATQQKQFARQYFLMIQVCFEDYTIAVVSCSNRDIFKESCAYCRVRKHWEPCLRQPANKNILVYNLMRPYSGYCLRDVLKRILKYLGDKYFSEYAM